MTAHCPVIRCADCDRPMINTRSRAEGVCKPCRAERVARGFDDDLPPMDAANQMALDMAMREIDKLRGGE